MGRYADHKWFAIAPDGRKVEISEAVYDAFSHFLRGGRRRRHHYGRVMLEYHEGKITRLEYRVYKVFGERPPVQTADDTSTISDLVPWSEEQDS